PLAWPVCGSLGAERPSAALPTGFRCDDLRSWAHERNRDPPAEAAPRLRSSACRRARGPWPGGIGASERAHPRTAARGRAARLRSWADGCARRAAVGALPAAGRGDGTLQPAAPRPHANLLAPTDRGIELPLERHLR